VYDLAEVSHTHPGGSEAFPVGALFLSLVATDPATLLGYGTWAAFGAGRMLVGLDAGDADFDTVRETGGAKTHGHGDNLGHAGTAVANHVFTQPGAHAAHAANIAHVHQMRRERSATTGAATTQIARTADASSTVDETVNTESSGVGSSLAHSAHAGGAVDAHGVTQPNAHGAHAAVASVPPYVVVYMWERTA